MSLRRLLYSLFLYLLFPLVLLRLLWRSRANPDYRKRWSERLGFVNKQNSPNKHQSILWVHSVSVGETIAALPLIEALLETYKLSQILITTTTPTGSDRVKSLFAKQIEQQRLIHVYFPYDLNGVVARFLKHFNPKILIVVETEIWPNLYANCHKNDIPVLMVNARLSEKSTNSYLKIKGLITETLAKVSTIAVRSDIDAQRFIQLGANPYQIKEIGNLKYDIKIDAEQVTAAKKHLKKWNIGYKKNRPVFVAASTHRGEDSKLLFIYLNLLQQFPDLMFILAPRHPERFDEVYRDCLQQLPEDISLIRHSQYSNQSDKIPQVILADSMGEMQMWFATADIVFIGGSLVNTGGHNPLEATIFGVPVVSGPHMFNFEDIASKLSVANLLYICSDEFEIAKKVESILLERSAVDTAQLNYSETAHEFMQQHRGVTARLLKVVAGLLSRK